MRRARCAVLVAVTLVVLAACGGSSKKSSATSATTATTSGGTATTTATGSSDIERISSAIEAGQNAEFSAHYDVSGGGLSKLSVFNKPPKSKIEATDAQGKKTVLINDASKSYVCSEN